MTANEMTERLKEPFEINEIKFKPQIVRKDQALAVPFIDSRLVMDRLDEVFGPGGWADHYDICNDGSVVCTIRVCVEGQWVEKSDVGSQSEQPDGGDRLKAAFSDALKRAAVKLGIGRYIYRLPMSWVDFDPVKKRITKNPQLPNWAIPKKKQPKTEAPYVDPNEVADDADETIQPKPAAKPQPQKATIEEPPFDRLDKRLTTMGAVENGSELLKIAKGCDSFLAEKIPSLGKTTECVSLLEKELDTAQDYFHDLSKEAVAEGFMKLKSYVRSQI